MIPDAVRDAVRAAIDMGEVVAQYIPLRKRGARLTARCPFHDERTPSFHVIPDRGLFHCFGCKASGDVFDFYQRMEGVSYPEAVRTLGERAGVMVEENREPGAMAEERRARETTERLAHACDVAAAFFEQALWAGDDACLARDELTRRGVSIVLTGQFRLGYAPAAWDALAQHYKARGVSPADGEAAGLILPSKRGGGYYDRFRHRLMFPVWDRNGRVVAFSGRVLPVTEAMPEGMVPEGAGKYVNSPETALFRKGEALYGLHQARPGLRHAERAVLVEGNFDVVSMHQAGFTETVAPLGTAFTEHQARLLRRFTESVALAFDGDDAGRKATRAAHDVCAKVGLTARVVALPRGADPDALLRREGGHAIVARGVRDGPSLLAWLVDDAATECGDRIEDRLGALRSLAPRLSALADPIERAHYTGVLAHALYLEPEQVRAAVEPSAPPAPAATPAPVDGHRRRLGGLVGLLLRAPQLLADPGTDALVAALPLSFPRQLIETAQAQWRAAGKLDAHGLLAVAASPEGRQWLTARLALPVRAPTTADRAELAAAPGALGLQPKNEASAAAPAEVRSGA